MAGENNTKLEIGDLLIDENYFCNDIEKILILDVGYIIKEICKESFEIRWINSRITSSTTNNHSWKIIKKNND